MGKKPITPSKPPFEVGDIVSSRHGEYAGLLLKIESIYPSERYGSGYGARCVGAITGKYIKESYVDSAWFVKVEDPKLSPYRVELLLRKSDNYFHILAAEAIKQLRLQKSPIKK